MKELRSWLEKFGDKNKQHYKRGISHGRQLNPDEENLLTIQTKPSNASTSPSSSADSVSSEDDASISMTYSSSPTVVKDSSAKDEEKSGARIEDVGADRDLYYPDPSFIDWSDDSSVEDGDDLGEIEVLKECFNPEFKESNFATESKNSRRVTFGGIQGAGSMSTHDQLPMNSNQTSLVHDALGVKLSSNNRDVVNREDNQTISNKKQPQQSVFRKKIDPVFSEFLQPKQQTLLKSRAQKSVRPPRSSVGAAIDLFGGPGTRKSIVSRRTDELQRRWSESRAVTHVKKTKWSVCEKTGVFKRKIVVEPEHRSI